MRKKTPKNKHLPLLIALLCSLIPGSSISLSSLDSILRSVPNSSLLLLPPHTFPLLQYGTLPLPAALWDKNTPVGALHGCSGGICSAVVLSTGCQGIFAPPHFHWELQRNPCSCSWISCSPCPFGALRAISHSFPFTTRQC